MTLEDQTKMEQHPYNWQPVRHTVFRDEALADIVHKEGIAVRPFLEPEALEALREVFLRYHSIPKGDGGMFYTLYSQDLDYREKVHAEASAVLKPVLDKWFKGYRNVINSFVVKVPGKASEFAIHQDTSALDEFKYSPLTAWIPLWDVTSENGAMCVVPRTHGMFSPYRGISFPFPFQGITDTVRRYLEPVPVKAGEAVLFDPRILHNSLPNTSDRERVALICGVFPEEAQFRICFKENPEAPIELISQEDDFLLKYPNFMHYCHARPVTGTVTGTVEDLVGPMDGETFERKAAGLGLEPQDILPPPSEERCNMIAEPDAEDRAPLAQVIAEPAPVVEEKKGGFFSRLFGGKN